MLKNLSASKKWVIVTLIFIVLSYIIIGFMNLSGLIFAGVIVVYFAVSIMLFYKTILGELGFYYQAFGQYDKGLKLCKLAYEKGSKSAKAMNFYGITLLREGKGKESLEIFQRGLKYNKNTLLEKYLYANIASSYWVMNDIDKAIETILTLKDKYSYLNPDVNTTLGFMYLLKNDFENAENCTNEALQDDPAHGPALDNLGQIRFKQEKYDEAEQYFLKALEHKGGMADSKYYLGLIYEMRGDTEQSQKYFNEASECKITALNTITKEQIASKIKE